MVSGKVKLTIGRRRKPSPERNQTVAPPSSPVAGKASSRSAFSRSFGVYFPRNASTQVRPKPPDVAELIRTVEELQIRESLLKTEIIEQRLFRECAAMVPLLENEISSRDTRIRTSCARIESLESENERLKKEVELLRLMMESERAKAEEKWKSMEAEVSELKKTVSKARDEVPLSFNRLNGVVDVILKPNTCWNSKKVVKTTEIGYCDDVVELKREDERLRISRPSSHEIVADSADSVSSSIVSRGPRVPNPPPKRSPAPPLSPATVFLKNDSSETPRAWPPPPPPPPPPPKRGPPSLHMSIKGSIMNPTSAKMRRVPEVVELYHLLMHRDSRKDALCSVTEIATSSNARDMIGEIENRSAHLLAIKMDVETQGDFIRYLTKEVEKAEFTQMSDVVPFMEWLDDELSFLVDERAVLKHFEWPEQKADALREAAFGYADVKKLESEVLSFFDDPRQACGVALKKMQMLFDKLEHSVYNLSRMRESTANHYRLFRIPVEWMQETGSASQIKMASVKLAMKYMRRVSGELESGSCLSEEEELILHAVRFAFRVHQFAGGFDVETMRAFQELREKAGGLCHNHNNQTQHRHFSK